MRAFILAAGAGERLRPLTLSVPKPALPVGRRLVVSYAIEACHRAGIREIGVNLHHLGSKVAQAVRCAAPKDMEVTFFHEERLLGTGGGLKNASEFFGGETFAVLNADTITQVDLSAMIEFHRRNGAMATMVVKPSAEAARFGAVGVDEEGRVKKLALYFDSGCRLKEECIFAGIHLLEPKALDYLPGGKPSCIIRDCYKTMLEQGKPVFGFVFDGFFADIGLPRRYVETVFELTREERNADGVVFCGPAEIGEGARIGPLVVIGSNCSVGEGATVRRAILLEGSRIAEGEVLEDCIVYPEGRIAVPGLEAV